MGKLRKVQRCYHCGAILQSTNPKARGYITPEVLNREVPVQIIYCDDCYNSMIEMNSTVLKESVDQEVLKILDDAVASDAYIIWVLDLFSFNGNINSEIAKKIRNNKVSVLATKRDLFGKAAKDDDLIDYLRKRFQKFGIDPATIRLLSAYDKIDGTELIKTVNDIRKGHDVYMIGNLSSGKTTIINKAMKNYVNKTKREVKTEVYEGTSVKVLEIPLSRSASFYELPGISQTNSVVNKVEKEIQKMITPKNEVRVHLRTVSTGDALMIGSLASFEIVKGKTFGCKFYSSEKVEVKKLSSKNLSKLFIENIHTQYVRPVSHRYSSFRDYDMFEYSMENDGKQHDIIIEGLGWLSFVAKGQVIRVTLPRGCALNETLAKVK